MSNTKTNGERWEMLLKQVNWEEHRAFMLSLTILSFIDEYMQKNHISIEELSEWSGISIVKLNHFNRSDTLIDMVTLSKILHCLDVRLDIEVVVNSTELPKEIVNDL